MIVRNKIGWWLIMLIFIGFMSCKNRKAASEPVIVDNPANMDAKVSEKIKGAIFYALDNAGKINDSLQLASFQTVKAFYAQSDYQPFWSSRESWLPMADTLFNFINQCAYFGLFKSDYHFNTLDTLRQKIALDSVARTDATLWTKADLLLTDAFMQTLQDLKQGRLVPDSAAFENQPLWIDSFFVNALNLVKKGGSIFHTFSQAEPNVKDYQNLRFSVKDFVDQMDTVTYSNIVFPYSDSLKFVKSIYKRLQQGGYGVDSVVLPDEAEFSKALKKYQADKNLVVDGKAGAGVVKSLNLTDEEKFKRIAISLDRYKMLNSVPQTYVWVNIPAYYLKVVDKGEVVLTSKVIVGKPITRTPELVSAISDMVTYPTWTIPSSIIKKEILPQLKKDPGYLARKGFNLMTYEGEIINPYTVNWSKYNKGIPWKVVQVSGDDNALGVFKFNFKNPYSVYLHDTNQRYLFKNSNRALSHGCVRVEQWKQLSAFVSAQDSMAMPEGGKLAYNADSINTWINNKSRKQIMVKNKLPLYIAYVTCEGDNGKITFYDDVYGEDLALSKKYFAHH